MTNRPEHRQDMVHGEMSEKAVVRARVLSARRNLVLAVRDEADAALVRVAVGAARGLGRVAAYAPMRGEPGGPDLVPALAAVVGELILPVLLPDRDLDWAAYDGSLLTGAAGFAAPDGPRLGAAAVGSAEVVFVPAVAVDRAGRRLGRGGGSFDRALARVRPGVPVLALLYPDEWVDRVPVEEHDQPVSGVLLPGGAQSCGSRRADG
jgi:5-formyltetrahydrofolate cyclo-ligase